MFSNDNVANSFETVPKLSLQVELGITGRNEGDRNEGSAGQNKHPTDVRLRARLRIGLGQVGLPQSGITFGGPNRWSGQRWELGVGVECEIWGSGCQSQQIPTTIDTTLMKDHSELTVNRSDPLNMVGLKWRNREERLVHPRV